ncbi:MAG: NnrU family protein [Rubrivivax sp.]|nr:NnrU family protein [Rubrivivax sp.]
MTLLILGLVLFLGTHSVRIFADGWRTAQRARLGENAWKGAYSLISLAGFVMLCYGYGQARLEPTVLWASPIWTRHLAALLLLPAFVFIVAAHVPGNAIKARLKHPMVLGVKVWALAHLLANNMLADLVLFGSFLVWAVLDYRSSRLRDAAAGTVYPPGRLGPTLVTVVAGLVLYAVFAFWAHRALFGVPPFGV